MSQWKRGAKFDNNNDNNYNYNKNDNKNKNQDKDNNFTRTKSFEQYSKKNTTQNNNPNNYSNNYHLRRSVSYDSDKLKSYGRKIQTKENNIVIPLLENIHLDDHLESKWKDAIEKENDLIIDYINENDPKYWNGPYWNGPMTIKIENNKSKSYQNYMNILKNVQVQPSTIIIPHSKTKFSRNNKDWYDNKEQTYSKEELENIKEYEFQKSMGKFSLWCQKKYQSRKHESDEYYYQTGQLDSFAIVEKEQEEYEEYCKNLEQEEEKYDEDVSDDEF